jgi:hypothetical protein
LISHLTALRYHHILGWLFLHGSCGLDHLNNIHALNNTPEHDMLVIQEWSLHSGDEELTAIGVGT